jgi:hypothetical protein
MNKECKKAGIFLVPAFFIRLGENLRKLRAEKSPHEAGLENL